MDVRYSVYSAKDDMPIIIAGTIPQCAKALGITYTAFVSQASRQRNGQPKSGISKHRIIRDCEDDYEA